MTVEYDYAINTGVIVRDYNDKGTQLTFVIAWYLYAIQSYKIAVNDEIDKNYPSLNSFKFKEIIYEDWFLDGNTTPLKLPGFHDFMNYVLDNDTTTNPDLNTKAKELYAAATRDEYDFYVADYLKSVNEHIDDKNFDGETNKMIFDSNGGTRIEGATPSAAGLTTISTINSTPGYGNRILDEDSKSLANYYGYRCIDHLIMISMPILDPGDPNMSRIGKKYNMNDERLMTAHRFKTFFDEVFRDLKAPNLNQTEFEEKVGIMINNLEPLDHDTFQKPIDEIPRIVAAVEAYNWIRTRIFVVVLTNYLHANNI